MSSEQPESRHAVTDPEKCLIMGKKYGWKLLRIEPTLDRVLKVNCVFEGETKFPTYFQED